MFPAARITDPVTCPTCGPSVITTVMQIKVVVGGLPVARTTDICMCIVPGLVAKASTKVMVQMLPCARVLDVAGHGGVISMGFPKVLVGG